MKFKSRMLVMALMFGITGIGQASEWSNEKFESRYLLGGVETVSEYSGSAVYRVEDGPRYVKNVVITAEALSSPGGWIEVFANGDLKGTLFIPNRDPDFQVNIGETIRSIEIRHRSGPSVKIFKVKAWQSCRCLDEDVTVPFDFSSAGPLDYTLPSSHVMEFLATKAKDIVRSLRDDTDPKEEYVEYLLPIKVAAARAKPIAQAEGDSSRKTIAAMTALADQIGFADPLITALMKRESTDEKAITLSRIRHQIMERLD